MRACAYDGVMTPTTSTFADTARLSCAKCAATIIVHDVIGVRYPGGHYTLLTLGGFVDPADTLCTDCEEAPGFQSDEWLESLYASEPMIDIFDLPDGWIPGGGLNQ